MRQPNPLLFASILFAAFLPVTAWGYGMYDYDGDRRYLPYAGSQGWDRNSGSLRLQKGMTEDGYYVRANLQGLRPGDVQVYPRRGRLVVEITKSNQRSVYRPDARGASRWQGRIRRQLRLPYDADISRMTTSSRNGIMEIYIPRRGQ